MIRVELTECKLYEIYDDFLNNTNDLVTICGYEYEPAHALKLVDKISYNVEFYNWLDLMVTDGSITCIDDKYYQEY